MGGRGGNSGLSGGAISYKEIASRLPDEEVFKPMRAPKLEGSEKQVKWAKDIRKRIINELFVSTTQYTSDGNSDTLNTFTIAAKGKDAIINDIQRAYNIRKHEPNPYNKDYTPKKVSEYNKKILDTEIGRYKDMSDRMRRFKKIGNQTSAKWWIENRGEVYKMKKYINGKSKNF